MAEHKYYNRYMETLLRDVEFFNYLCELGSSGPSNHDKIKEMWYTFLIDQFHDVLPGTCTFLTVEDTRENFAALKKTCEEIYSSSIK
jgi:alpha-mannosidase